MSAFIDWHGCRLYIGGYAGVQCRSLLEITPENLSYGIDLYRTSLEWNNFEIDGIYLYGRGFGNLTWLREFPNLRNLYVDLMGDTLHDLGNIHALTNLRRLGLADVVSSELDFSCFPDLACYAGKWSPAFKSLGKCSSLDTLHLSSYAPKDENLEEYVGLHSLRMLTLDKPKIKSLSGIRGLEDLYHFGILQARQLETLTELEMLGSLRTLELDACKNIRNMDAIANVPKLRKLMLSNCGDIASIGFLKRMRDIEFFSFVGTRVRESDLSALCHHPKLKYVGFLDAKHYSHTSTEVRKILEKR